ncbi:MAG TPA: carbamoyl-phosphate synthase large subunit, partial [Oscillospiraceae bacterium]|nr:carbamoyl-phosphate synthase large subunit [Oscillospiraceae bacterium]
AARIWPNWVPCKVKLPKWPFDKFMGASRKLGTQMKATGEVMSIAPSFEMALMKAVRGAEISLDTPNAKPMSDAPVRERLREMDDRRLFTVFEALKSGVSVNEIFEITRIDRWFLHKLKKLADYELSIADGMDEEAFLRGKKFGYTNEALARLSGAKSLPEYDASYKMVDTCGAEFDAETPYFYSTYDKSCEARSFRRSGKPTVIVLGSGPIRIGQGIEFDYSSVHCVWTLKELGYDVVIINNNPETVSTDYDTADRLYFEPLCAEDVMNVVKVEKPVGVVVAFGGQTAIKLTKFLDQSGIPILGTSAEGIDIAEDRERFDELLGKLHIRRPKGMGILTMEEALSAAEELGYPVLLRPSYVIGGQNMKIVHNADDVRRYMERILSAGIENPVLVDKYMMGTELEVDVISDGKDVLIPGVMEHIERAGVHSGDSIAVYPPYSINDRMMKTVVDCSARLALSLGTKGLVNIQYLIYQNELYVIEVNPRASRTVPYISKVTGVPMVDLASRVMTGASLSALGFGTGLYRTPPYFAVKVPVFSFEKLTDVNSYLGPEMKSTGEVLGIGKTVNEALFKGLTSAGLMLKPAMRGSEVGILISVDTHDQLEIVTLAKKLDDLGFRIYATEETADSISKLGIDVESLKSIRESDNTFRLLESGKINYIVYTGALMDSTVDDYIALHRRALQLSIPCLTSLDTANALADILASRYNQRNTELVDINHLREKRQTLRFSKMEAAGDDYIFIENFDHSITCPESLCISLCNRHTGIGGFGIVLLERSEKADIRMRMFNRDGSEGKMAGNCIRSVGKYLYDNGLVAGTEVTVETASGVKRLTLYTSGNKVTFVSVDMGRAILNPEDIPCTLHTDKVIHYPAEIGGRYYNITCVSMGNPHCVVFAPRVDEVDIETVGPLFENADIFPERVNTEFIRVVNKNTIKMRVYERGNGETWACGTGACAAVVAACENGFCGKGEDITVKVRGGDLIVNYTDEGVTLAGDTRLVYEGVTEY